MDRSQMLHKDATRNPQEALERDDDQTPVDQRMVDNELRPHDLQTAKPGDG